MHFTALFSTRTSRTTIHATSCPTIGRATANGSIATPIGADTPDEAAAIFADYEDLEGRSLPMPTICRCAK